jgi:hypothetical protein
MTVVLICPPAHEVSIDDTRLVDEDSAAHL